MATKKRPTAENALDAALARIDDAHRELDHAITALEPFHTANELARLARRAAPHPHASVRLAALHAATNALADATGELMRARQRTSNLESPKG